MPTWVAFLRAINLGKQRRFPTADVVAATEAAGGAGVATYLATGNVRLTVGLRSRDRLERALEAAYLADRGFEVPTIVFTPDELTEIAADAAEVGAGHPGRHYVSLLKQQPSAASVRAMIDAAGPGESAVVRGRAVHLLLGEDYRTARLTNTVVERHLGVATNRSVAVVRTVADRWGLSPP